MNKIIGRASRVEAKQETKNTAAANMKKGGKNMKGHIDYEKLREADNYLAELCKDASIFHANIGEWAFEFDKLPNAKRLETVYEQKRRGNIENWKMLSDDGKTIMNILDEGQELRNAELELLGDWKKSVKALLSNFVRNPKVYRSVLVSEYHTDDIENDAFGDAWTAYFDAMPMTVNCRISEGIQYTFTTGNLPGASWTDAERACIKTACRYLRMIRNGWTCIKMKLQCLADNMNQN